MTTIGLDFEDGLSPALAAAIRRASDLSPAMQAIADHLEFATRRRFETGVGPDGRPWQPSRRALEEGGKTLVKRGRLLGSIDRAFGPDSAVVGTNVVYARIQQLGGTIRGQTRADGTRRPLRTPFGPRGAVTLPARPFIGIDAADQAAIFDILRDHLGSPST